LKANWHENDNIQENWNVLNRALCEAKLDYVKSKQSDFRDSLSPLFERRNKLYILWLNVWI